jgi:hypothetical protein
MVESMRRVCRDREEAKAKGGIGAADVAHLSWRRSNETLLSVLQKHHFFPSA